MVLTRWFLLIGPLCVLLASCQSSPLRESPKPLPSQARVSPERNTWSRPDASVSQAKLEEPSPELPQLARDESAQRTLSDHETPLPSTDQEWDVQHPIQLASYGKRVGGRRAAARGLECFACEPSDLYGDFETWRPPGITGPWPPDEYICDGGDRLLKVQVDRDWTVRGLDQEDTIAHYDTLSGKTIVQPSNRVCIYAPRFAAVRHVTGVQLDEGHQWAAGVTLPIPPLSQDLHEGPNAVTQPVQLERSLAVTPAYAFLDRLPVMGLDNVRALQGVHFELLPHEDLVALEEITLDASQKARLAERTTAAKTWETATGLQIVIDHQIAVEAVRDTSLQETVTYDMPKGKPRLRIIKIANKQNALPGDIVEFTLRYDNVGTEEIGNVTIIDSLTTRLEYVADSAQSTRDANFVTAENEGDSLLLRWELKEPLKTGEGGLIRFQTRVR
jgi:uncharacterized repeat protein (TIGR01451 family)